MSMLDRFQKKLGSISTQRLQRLVWQIAIVLIAGSILFAGYYIWDRYIYLGDQSPIELDIDHLREAILEDPQDPDLRVALAERYLNTSMYREALDQSEEVLATYPENEGAMLVAGVAHVRLGQPLEAVQLLGPFTELRAEQPTAKADKILQTAYYFLGESLIKLERYEEAETALQAALMITPTDADSLYLLGLAQKGLQKYEAALESLQMAIRLVPNFTEAYGAMVDLYTLLNQSDYIAYARGMQAFSQKDYETALTHLEHVTQVAPDFAPAFLGLALTYEKQGQVQAAIEAIQRALELDPNDYASRHTLGRLEATLGNQD